MIEKLKSWGGRFDRMALRERAGVLAAILAILFFVVNALVLNPTAARTKTFNQQITASTLELDNVRKLIRELSGQLEREGTLAQQAQLDEMKRSIAEADALLAQFDKPASRVDAAPLKEFLSATPGLELVSLRTLPVAVAFQSKAPPAGAGKATVPPSGGAATPSATSKPVAGPVPESAPRPQRTIYRHGVEISIKGNYLAFLPYLEKLQKYPGRLVWGDVSLDVQSYPVSVLKFTVYTLSGQASSSLG
jgi:MSHA biogenesis protein MshJ